jgi:hypothetical protein
MCYGGRVYHQMRERNNSQSRNSRRSSALRDDAR